MAKLKWKVSKTLRANSLDGETGAEQGHGWGSPSGLVGTGSEQARRTPGKPGLVMRSEQVWESWRQPWGEKEEQRERNVTTASMDHETAKAPLTCQDILWAPLIGDPLLWDWRQQDAGGGQSSSPCGSASGKCRFLGPMCIAQNLWVLMESLGICSIVRAPRWFWCSQNFIYGADFVGHTCPRDNLQPLMGLSLVWNCRWKEASSEMPIVSWKT